MTSGMEKFDPINATSDKDAQLVKIQQTSGRIIEKGIQHIKTLMFIIIFLQGKLNSSTSGAIVELLFRPVNNVVSSFDGVQRMILLKNMV